MRPQEKKPGLSNCYTLGKKWLEKYLLTRQGNLNSGWEKKPSLKFLTKSLSSHWFEILIYIPCVVRNPQNENKCGPGLIMPLGQKAKVNINLEN